MARRNTASLFNDNITLFILDIKTERFTAHSFINQFLFRAIGTDFEIIKIKEHFQHFFRSKAQRSEQNSRRQFAAAINTDKNIVFWIKFEIQPGTTIGYYPGIEQ